jgi:ComEC/Rec2-related protein
VSRAAVLCQRLPCVGLFLCAAAGVVLGRYATLPGWAFASGGALCLAAVFFQPLRRALPVGIVLAFAAAQAWQYRESAATRLAAEIGPAAQTCLAEISVLETPHVSETGKQCRFAARLEGLEIAGRPLPSGCDVIVRWTGQPPAYGQRYSVRGSIANCPPQRNPGAFDYTSWLADNGIRSELRVLRPSDARLLGGGGNAIVHFAQASRAWIERTVSLGIAGTPEVALIRGMTLGDTSDAPDAIKEDFRETGTYHLFSVSGLHVGIVAVILWTVLGACGVSQRRSVIIVIPALFFYALITGLSPASLRAAIMLSILASSLLIDRPPVPLNTIAAAGLVILLGNSSQLFNAGFQLSFGAVTLIILLALPVQHRIEAFFAPDPFLPRRLIPAARRVAFNFASGTAALVAVSFAAWLASLPLIIFYFHLVSLTALPANLVAVPLSSASLALVAVSLIVAPVSPWLAEVFNQANYLLAKIILLVVQTFAALPGSYVYVGPPQLPGTVATLTVLDADAGGAAALLAGKSSWLVDSGPTFFAETVTLPFLRTKGINRLDTLVLTHGDAKHIAGFDCIIDSLNPREVLDSGLVDRSPTRKHILALLEEQRIPVILANSGLTVPVAGAMKVEVLYPPAGTRGVCADDSALVLRVEAGDFAALLCSDAGPATEQWLLAHAADRLPCDVLTMGRHISGLSGDREFLRAAQPRVVIATGATYPAEEKIPPDWAEAVRAQGIDLIRQDEAGAVTVTIRRDAFTVKPFLATVGPARTYPNSHATDPLR